MKVSLYTILLQILLISCSGQDCNKLPNHFNSYDQAISLVKKSNFKYKDEVSTSKSSWIQSAVYYSCDGNSGYFIFKAKGKDYIHSGVPDNIWQGFKNSESLGSFYNKYIKGRFTLKLNQ
jgi:hypothetical protein